MDTQWIKTAFMWTFTIIFLVGVLFGYLISMLGK